jgi:hypothetical protein
MISPMASSLSMSPFFHRWPVFNPTSDALHDIDILHYLNYIRQTFGLQGKPSDKTNLALPGNK